MEGKGERKESITPTYIINLNFSTKGSCRKTIPIVLDSKFKPISNAVDYNSKDIRCMLTLVKRSTDRLALFSENKTIPVYTTLESVQLLELDKKRGVVPLTDVQAVKEERLYTKSQTLKTGSKAFGASVIAPVTSASRGAVGAVGSSWIPLVGTVPGLIRGLKRGAQAPFEYFLGDTYLSASDASLVKGGREVPFEFAIDDLVFPRFSETKKVSLDIKGTFVVDFTPRKHLASSFPRLELELSSTVIPWNMTEYKEDIYLSKLNQVTGMTIDSVDFSLTPQKKNCREHNDCIYFDTEYK